MSSVYRETEQFKTSVRNIVKVVKTILSTSDFSTPNLNFLIRVLENKQIKRYLSFLPDNNKVPITQDRDLIGLVIYYMIHHTMSFDDAFDFVFVNGGDIHYLCFSHNQSIDGEECSECSGNREHECSECNGRGEVECDECYGSGSNSCETCFGQGEFDNGEECNECSGEGSIDCPSCDGGGSKDCEGCWNSGMVDCEECETGFEDYTADFVTEVYFSLDPTILEFERKGTDYDEFEEFCKNNGIDYAYYRTFNYTLRAYSGDDDDIRSSISGAGFIQEGDSSQAILISTGIGHLPDSSDIDMTLRNMF